MSSTYQKLDSNYLSLLFMFFSLLATKQKLKIKKLIWLIFQDTRIANKNKITFPIQELLVC